MFVNLIVISIFSFFQLSGANNYEKNKSNVRQFLRFKYSWWWCYRGEP